MYGVKQSILGALLAESTKKELPSSLNQRMTTVNSPIKGAVHPDREEVRPYFESRDQELSNGI